MSTNKHFEELVKKDNPVGEVTAVNRFLITVKGLHPVNFRALVMFENGSKGVVHRVLEDRVLILHLGRSKIKPGMVVVVQHQELVAKVGKDFVGRIVNVTGEPLDNKGPIAADAVWPVFNHAPKMNERELLSEQLETGVTVIDSLFPLVKGQRIAIMGDSKSGKSALASQLLVHNKDRDLITVYVLIGKRRSEIDTTINRLVESGAIKNSVVVVATMFDSPILGYIAPYVACSIAEYLWQKVGKDVVVIYDDLTSHAFIYREISLLSGVSPGRESYPGDMFHAHSSLLERAGKLKGNGKTLTALPIVLASGGDITAYLPTNIMSITDGQWVLDMKIFHQGIRPAISSGLSVTRVGSRGHSPAQKLLADRMFKTLAAHQQAQEYAHFGSELALSTKRDLERGKLLYDILNQGPLETFGVIAQQLMLDVILGLSEGQNIDLNLLKEQAVKQANEVKNIQDFEKIRDLVKQQSLMELKR